MFSAVLAEETELVNHLAIPAPVFGVVAFVAFLGLLAVTYAFRSVWTRH